MPGPRESWCALGCALSLGVLGCAGANPPGELASAPPAPSAPPSPQADSAARSPVTEQQWQADPGPGWAWVRYPGRFHFGGPQERMLVDEIVPPPLGSVHAITLYLDNEHYDSCNVISDEAQVATDQHRAAIEQSGILTMSVEDRAAARGAGIPRDARPPGGQSEDRHRPTTAALSDPAYGACVSADARDPIGLPDPAVGAVGRLER